MSTLHVLLPDLSACGDDPVLKRLLRRGDRLPDHGSNYLDAVAAHFRVSGGHLPVAALTREELVGDAEASTWLCADLAWLQPDMTGVRLLACGNLDVTREEAEELARTLRPLFGDRGCLLETTTPARWHLRLPRGAQPPAFTPPDAALGDDLFEHLPQGPDGRRWRVLLNEAQVLLHQHPVNSARAARGQVPVNSIWLWGGGALPAWVGTELGQVFTDQPMLRALARSSGATVLSLEAFDTHPRAAQGGVLLDLEQVSPGAIPWSELEATLRDDALDSLSLEFASGERLLWRRRHGWRLWRRL